jgi:hypothetical protein
MVVSFHREQDNMQMYLVCINTAQGEECSHRARLGRRAWFTQLLASDRALGSSLNLELTSSLATQWVQLAWVARGRVPIRLVPMICRVGMLLLLNPLISTDARCLLVSPTPVNVMPAKAGIQSPGLWTLDFRFRGNDARPQGLAVYI